MRGSPIYLCSNAMFQAPIIPVIASPTDTSNFDSYEDESPEQGQEVAMSPKYRRKISSYDIPFIGYTYRYVDLYKRGKVE